MDNQQRVNRRRRRNLPAELKVEIVDCLPLENAVHFLANVPSRLIIHNCAPRVRRMLKMINQIAKEYASTLPTPDSDGHIHLYDGHQHTPELDFFLRYGGANCRAFIMWRGLTGDSFAGYPVDFFNELIKHYYKTKVPTKSVRHLNIDLSLENPALWPAALIQPQAGEMISVEEVEVYNGGEWAEYILRNKHNPGIAFKLLIYFQRGAKCYQQMTSFIMWRVEDVQCGHHFENVGHVSKWCVKMVFSLFRAKWAGDKLCREEAHSWLMEEVRRRAH